jgi:hypothetical protein
MVNPNPKEETSSTFISNARAIRRQHVFVFNGFSCESGEAKRRYLTNFQKKTIVFSSLEVASPLER